MSMTIPTAKALSRRGFLGGIAAACAAALVPRSVARAIAELPAPQRSARVLDLTSFDSMLKDVYRPDLLEHLAQRPRLTLIKKRKGHQMELAPGHSLVDPSKGSVS